MLRSANPLKDVGLGTSSEAHSGGVSGNLLATLPLDVVALSLESSNHLLGSPDVGAWDERGSLGLLATVGVDDLALVGSHVHVLLAITIGDPAARSC